MKTRTLLIITFIMVAAGNIAAQTDHYYFSKIVNASFEEVTDKTKASLKEQGFGIITEIDMNEKLAEKIEDLAMKPYKILGACNPEFAHKTLQLEENIGLFLPCKVLVKKIDEHTTEVVMVDPSALMNMLGNKELMPLADIVTARFRKALENL